MTGRPPIFLKIGFCRYSYKSIARFGFVALWHVRGLCGGHSQLLNACVWPLRLFNDLRGLRVLTPICCSCCVYHFPHSLPAMPCLFCYVNTSRANMPLDMLSRVLELHSRDHSRLPCRPFNKIRPLFCTCFRCCKTITILYASV